MGGSEGGPQHRLLAPPARRDGRPDEGRATSGENTEAVTAFPSGSEALVVWVCGLRSVDWSSMSDVTRILDAIEQGDPYAAEQLLPLVYDELRQLAAQRLAHEKPGQTLQATALVHDVYLRLVDTEKAQHWNSRGHFFAAAAEAMRRILVEQARRKQAEKHGGG